MNKTIPALALPLRDAGDRMHAEIEIDRAILRVLVGGDLLWPTAILPIGVLPDGIAGAIFLLRCCPEVAIVAAASEMRQELGRLGVDCNHCHAAPRAGWNSGWN